MTAIALFPDAWNNPTIDAAILATVGISYAVASHLFHSRRTKDTNQ